MLAATAEYKAYEAQLIGATPAVRATFLPYLWPNGVNAAGEFTRCAYVAPDRIQADYEGFIGGYWISPVLTSNLQVPTSPSVVTWVWNFPGYVGLFYFRAADDLTALAAAAWTLIVSGDTVQIAPFYQFLFTLDGYRAWAEEAAGGYFGNNTLVGIDGGGAANYLVATKYVLPIHGLFSRLTFYYAASGNVKVGIYADVGGAPGALIGASTEVAVTGGQFNDIDIPETYLPAGTYWIASLDAVSAMRRYFAPGGVSQSCYMASPYADGLPAVISPTYQDICYTCYASYVPNDFTAYAVDVADVEAKQGYASDANVPGDVLTYIEALQLLGEFTVVRDIETAGTVSMEAPKAFDDLVAASYSGLTVNNRQGTLDEFLVWTPAPLFSPDKSSFIFAQQMTAYASPAEFWKQANIQLKIELGWSKGGWFASGFGADEWFGEGFTAFVTLFLGRVKNWGPVTRSLGSPNTVEIYAEDLIADCMKRRICLPAADGTPAPIILGEFLCSGEEISGWSPAPVVKSAYFESGNLNELDHVVVANGGTFALITPGLSGAARAARAVTDGTVANQKGYGEISVPSPGEIFVTGSLQFAAIPTAAPVSENLTVFQTINTSGTPIFNISVDNAGMIYSSLVGPSKFNILGYVGVPLRFALWVSPVTPGGRVKLWLNGEEVLDRTMDLGSNPIASFRFGAQTGAAAEAWTIDFGDDIEMRLRYYHTAFKVDGGPFADIGQVFIDNIVQPDSKTYVKEGVTYTQTLTRMSQYGIVQFASVPPGGVADTDFGISGDVKIRVIEKAGGRHALDILIVPILYGLSGLAVYSDFKVMVDTWLACTKNVTGISAFLATYSLTSYIDAAALAAAYLAVPDDIINARFEGGGTEKQGLKDFASLGLPASDAVKEITARMLYWVFTDAGRVKVVPYTGTSPTTPTDPLQILTASNKWENNQVIDLDNMAAYVTAIYGWYARNPGLFYVAGDQTAGGEGVGIDFSWDGPVACERRGVIKSKADLLLKFLSAQDRIDPVSMSLAGVRLELMTDAISLRDAMLNDVAQNYVVAAKEVGLDLGSRVVTLQLIRFLGEQ